MKFLKKFIPNKSYTTILLVTILIIIIQIHTAHAGVIDLIFGYTLTDFLNQVLAVFFTIFQNVAAGVLFIAGMLLSFSINLTLHIKDFVSDASGIYTTWKVLRDISGIFIIFFLLYAALQLITGIKKPNFSDLIKNIVLAGILINFSFFFAGLGIDLSNLVSIQLYKAIAPQSTLSVKNMNPRQASKTSMDGGISAIFMTHLDLTTLYSKTKATELTDTANGNEKIKITSPLEIIIFGIVSIVIILTAAFSFAIAALMFIVRFVLLIFLLAFSPIWFMSFISPELKKYSADWVKYYKAMLLIMPVYLLLMYMSLSVLTTTKFFGNDAARPAATKTTTPPTTASTGMISETLAATDPNNDLAGRNKAWYHDLLRLAINAVVVIFMMNVPLIGAISIGGSAVSFLGADKFGAGNIWKKVGGYTARSTAGKLGSNLDKRFENTSFGNSASGRFLRSYTTGAAATAKFGGVGSYKDVKDENKEIAKKQREIDNVKRLKVALARGTVSSGEVSTILGSMSSKEIESLDKSLLGNEHVLPHLSSTTFSSINKGDKSEGDKAHIQQKRSEALDAAVTAGSTDKIKNLIKNMTGEEVIKVIERHPPGTAQGTMIIEQLKPGQLKDMENLDDGVRRQIGREIDLWTGAHQNNHSAYDYIDKNRSLWV